jgi:hypothetical protein
MNTRPIHKSELATSHEEFRELVEGDADWIARSADDVRQLRETGYGPLVKLPEADFRAFLASLEFEGGAVSTGSYRPLMATLSLTDIFEVFERFGMSRELALEDQESACVGGTCEWSWGSFCSHITCGSHTTEPTTEPTFKKE